MNFEYFLIQQQTLHSAMQPQDIVKQCYQAAFGAEHLLSDKNAAREYLNSEMAKTDPSDLALYEEISENVIRINLAAWKKLQLPTEWLFQMFLSSSQTNPESKEIFLAYLNTAGEVLKKQSLSDFSQWQSYLTQYKALGMPSLHHSDIYRQKEKPAYRIIKKDYASFFPLLIETANVLRQKARCIIAMDGRAASGKTTTAKLLQKILKASLLEMDDFFLPPNLRTKERLIQPGGNIHYERFCEEVLPYLHGNTGFSYRKFDCSIGDYNGKKEITPANIYIIEGSYSLHPAFKNYADIKVFLDITPEEQKQRILLRNGKEMAKIFETKWVPMEEIYFNHFQIQGDITLTTTDKNRR